MFIRARITYIEFKIKSSETPKQTKQAEIKSGRHTDIRKTNKIYMKKKKKGKKEEHNEKHKH